jgi:hypothetical protein
LILGIDEFGLQPVEDGANSGGLIEQAVVGTGLEGDGRGLGHAIAVGHLSYVENIQYFFH